MNFLQQLEIRAKADAMQGKLMVVAGIVALVSSILIFKGENQILKGMLVPLGLLALVGIGYGGFLGYSRPIHIVKAQETYQTNSEQAIVQELEKAERDNKNYTMIKKMWPVLIAVGALLLFFFHGDYARGLLVGLLVLFVFGLVVDTFLHQHLKPYIELLRVLNAP